MTVSQEGAQPRADSSGVPVVSTSAFPGADGGVVVDTVVNDVFAHRRADELDAEVVYYHHRANQEEQALALATT
ncbi:MAG: hypothetical protein JO287_01325 [Pseudonocardiales bacterium]|nr:hypothetical protein [Pseudonocardiales bacterium]